jgi:VWFA-related protein
MRQGLRRLAASGALALAASGSALQNPRKPQPLIIQIGVDLIQIDAVVTDEKGRPVKNLGASDFVLEVDGEKRPVLNAAFFERPTRVAAAPEPGAATPGETGPPVAPAAVVREPSTVVFMVDDLNMSAVSMEWAKQSLSNFVNDWSQFHTRAGLRTTSTSDLAFSLYATPERFASAIKELKYNIRSTQGGTSNRTAHNDTNVTSRLTMGEEEDLVVRSPRAFEQFEQRIATLSATIHTLRAVPGRKAVVFISEGLTLGLRERDRINIDAPLLSFYDDSDVEGALRSLAEVANRASVVLYTVDPRGLAVHEPGAIDGVNIHQVEGVTRARRLAHLQNQRTLQQIAEETGGLSTVNTNRLESGLVAVLQDQGSYYLIGFEPPGKTFAKSSGRPVFHKIKLSVNRDGVKVRTRAGFYGVTDADMARKAR